MNDDKISNIDKRAAYMRRQAEEDNSTKVKSSAMNSVKIFINLSGDNTNVPKIYLVRVQELLLIWNKTPHL